MIAATLDDLRAFFRSAPLMAEHRLLIAESTTSVLRAGRGQRRECFGQATMAVVKA